jgi:hypothetical protein
MASLVVSVLPGESVRLCAAAQVEPFRDRREIPPSSYVLATVVADAGGRADFGNRSSRVEFVAFRSNGVGVKAMNATTRGGS